MTDEEIMSALENASKRVGPQMKASEPIAEYFAFSHLPAHLQEVSRQFAEMAVNMLTLPRCPERAAGLRKLLEAKDCAVRASLHRTA